MYLKSIALHNYRNYEHLNLNLNQGINVFLGDNGQGKTNLLESIYYLATGSNFRGNKDQEIIRWKTDYFRLEAQLVKDTSTRLFELEIYFDQQKNKQIKINGVKYKKNAELLGYLQVVLFSPEDLKIIKGGPVERRKYIDLEICQLDKKYHTLLQNYQKVLQQRNNLLKELSYKASQKNQLPIWNQQLIQYGSRIIYERIKFLRVLVPIARRLQKELTNEQEQFNVTYHSSLGPIGNLSLAEIIEVYQLVLAKNESQEISRGVTLWGPHRDDLIFYLNQKEIKVYGSQGQQRTGILALKLAELETFYKSNKEYPLLLLDDVMSELDDQRRKFLLKIIQQNKIQTIITGANLELVTREIGQDEVFLVQEGKIINQK